MTASPTPSGSCYRRGRLLTTAAVAVVAALLSAVAVPAQQGDSVRTDVQADRYRSRVVDGERITYLVGNVSIERDTLTVAADSALFYDATEEYDFFGNVRLTRGRSVVTCDEAYFNDRTRDADFVGDVRMVDGDLIGTGRRAEMRDRGDLLLLIGDARVVAPDYVVHADSVANREESETGEAFGHVIMVDPDGESVVRGEHAFFDRDGGRVTVDVAPRLETRQQGDDPLLAAARFMDFFEHEDRVVMIDSVRIRQGRSLALGDTARIYGREHMVLTGDPSMDDGRGTTMMAEVMKYWYVDGDLDRVRLEGLARMEDEKPAALAERYPGLPALNVLSGDTLTVQMEDGEPSRSMVLGGGRSVFVPDDAAKEVACNDVQGDTIVIAFEDRRVHQVDVRGAMSGTYSFIRLENLASLTSGAEATLDSLLHADGDSLRVQLPDSLRASFPDDVAGWRELEPAVATAVAGAVRDNLSAAQDSTLRAVLERGLASVTADTLADGGEAVDFKANREFVDYSGHQGIFQLGERQIAIRGDGQLVYGSMDLRAGDIRLDTIERELYAAESPLLVDGGQKMAGRDMAYDFGHRTGAVRQGATTMDGYYYVGRHIKRFGDGDLKIRGGKMTSCDLAKPHYHFWADKMKIQLGDKVVAKPIVMKIGEVPVFALPFFFKSLTTGRRSGIIFPTFDFGWSGRTGRYIRNWGYYWATNDYLDVTFRGDYNERRELTWQVSVPYVKRYDFNGNLLYSRRTTLGDDPQTKEWQLRWDHTQNELFDYYRFKADLRMSSQEISREDLISDVGQQVVNSQQESNIYLSRTWTNVSGSFNFKRNEYVNASDDDDLTNKRLWTQNFPQLSLSFKSRPLMSPLRGGQKGSFLGNVLRSTNLRHSYNASSTRTKYESTQNTLHKFSGSASLDVKPPRLLIFNVSTGVSAGLNWSRDETTGALWQVADGDTVYASAAEIVEESSKSLGVNTSLGTTLYGLFSPRIGSLRGVRHTMRMSVSHTWRPEIGGTQTADQRFGWRLSNRFDLKFADDAAGPDSTESFRKLDGVLDWTLSGSYDPDLGKDDRWSNIASTMTIKPGKSRNAKVTVNNTIDPYAMRVTNTRLTYGLNLSGRFDTGGTVATAEPERNEAIALLATAEGDSTLAPVVLEEEPWEDEEAFEDPDDGFTGFGIFDDESERSAKDETEGGRFMPWRAGSSFSYSRNHLTDDASARISLNASATLSPTWKLSWRAGYDLEKGELTTQSWNLEKDLHCWSLRFNRTVSVVDSQFGFVIALKAIPDIKVTKGREDLVGGAVSSLGRGLY